MDGDGQVEFGADVIVIKPRDPKTGNGTILFELSNRGGTGLGMFGRGSEDYGDGFLLEQGYTIVWVGWQFDVPRDRPLKAYVPIARDGDSPIRGSVRSQFIPAERTRTMPLADRNHVAYQPVDINDDSAVMTVRAAATVAPATIPRNAWKFADNSTVTMAAGFEPAKIYEVVYTAENPPFAGLGIAGVRDFVSYLKYGGGSPPSLLNDQAQYLKRAIGFGTSQSGRFLRAFLYYGFNADEKGRKVFDGVRAHVGGAGRGSFNVRFKPSRDGHPLFNLFYPTDLFPFTDLPETDPETGERAGLLDRVTAATAPKIFYTNGSYVLGPRRLADPYHGRRQTGRTTARDDQDLLPCRNAARSGGAAGAGQDAAADKSVGLPLDAARAAGGHEQLAEGRSGAAAIAVPSAGQDQLAPFEAIPFPNWPGLKLPSRTLHALRLDFGPDFATKGIMREPPRIGTPYPALVPRVSIEDGNETSGVRPVDLRVPLATYTGWNLRSPEIGAPDMLSDMRGSFIPFARTRAERDAAKDPRPSLEERYQGREDYLAKVRIAVGELVRERFLLERDVDAVVRQAGERWDLVTR